MTEDKITRQVTTDISGIVHDASVKSGIDPDTVALVEGDVGQCGLLTLTLYGDKNLQETTHRLPEELQ